MWLLHRQWTCVSSGCCVGFSYICWNTEAFLRVAPTLAFYLLVALFFLVCRSLGWGLLFLFVVGFFLHYCWCVLDLDNLSVSCRARCAVFLSKMLSGPIGWLQKRAHCVWFSFFAFACSVWSHPLLCFPEDTRVPEQIVRAVTDGTVEFEVFLLVFNESAL